MNRGYVHLWRKSIDAGWIRNHKLWAFWTWCLLKASYREHDVIVGLQMVHLMPGQFVFGRKKAAKETGLTEREIRTIVDLLKKCGNLTIKTTNKFSIITIINWPIYQGNEPDERPAKRPANDQQTTTNNKGKKGKNISVVHHADEKVSLEEGVKEILSLLNEKRAEIGGNGVRPITATGELEARLRDHSVVEVCRVILTKAADPHFRENPKYFHPETLFRKSNFRKYADEAELVRAARARGGQW